MRRVRFRAAWTFLVAIGVAGAVRVDRDIAPRFVTAQELTHQ